MMLTATAGDSSRIIIIYSSIIIDGPSWCVFSSMASKFIVEVVLDLA